MPREFVFQNGIFLRGITWVSKFFVKQSLVSLKAVKDSGLLSKKCEVGQNVSLFYSYNDLFHEK